MMNHDASNLFVHQRQEHFFEGGLFRDCFVKHKTEMFGDLGIPLTHHGEVVVRSLYTWKTIKTKCSVRTGFDIFFVRYDFFQIRPCPAANPLLTSVVFLKSWICRTGSDSMSVSSRETSLHCCQVKPVKNPLSMFFKLKSVTPCAIWTYHSNPQKVSKRFNSITSKSRGFYHFSLGVL